MPVSRTLITGASVGIGAELARQFAAGGSDLVLVARRLEKLGELACELRGKYGVKVATAQVDLTDREARQKLFEQFSSSETAIDVLVNNAGFGVHGKVADIDVQRQLDLVEVNVAALTHLSRLFLPGMIVRQSGGILNVASTAAFQAGPGMAAYYASKAYVLSFSEALIDELAGTGVRVSCLCPGPTTTEFEATAGLEKSKLFKFSPMTAREVAETGYRSFRKGKFLIVPGVMNQISTAGACMVPRFVSRKVANWLNNSGE